MKLRPYQEECLKALREAYNNGGRLLLVVLPTGAGKTVIASHLPEAFPELAKHGVLFIVNREELVQQAYDKFSRHGLRVGIERADSYANDEPVVVASIQTISRPDRLSRFPRERFGIVFIDEAHHAVSPSYIRVLEWFGTAKTSPETRLDWKLLIGLTATPDRADNVGLEAVFDQIAYELSLERLIEGGYLVKVKGMLVSSKTSLDSVAVRRGEFVEKQLSNVVNNPERNELIAKTYLENRIGPALAFTVTVEHAHSLAETMRRHGIKAYAISGSTPSQERARLVNDFREGKIDVLASAGVFNEGFDAPIATVGLMARPTLSGLLYRQQIGRILRPWPAPEEQTNGHRKTEALIIDFVDNSRRHSLITLPSLFGLPPKLNLSGSSPLDLKDPVEKRTTAYGYARLANVRTIRELETVIEYLDIMKPAMPATALAKISKFVWVEAGPNRYSLTVPNGTVFTVRLNALGLWEVHQYYSGWDIIIGQKTLLADAVALADCMVPSDYIPLLISRAKWRVLPPSPNQARTVWLFDQDVKNKFPTHEAFYRWLAEEYNKGNMDASRGALSLRISNLLSKLPPRNR